MIIILLVSAGFLMVVFFVTTTTTAAAHAQTTIEQMQRKALDSYCSDLKEQSTKSSSIVAANNTNATVFQKMIAQEDARSYQKICQQDPNNTNLNILNRP